MAVPYPVKLELQVGAGDPLTWVDVSTYLIADDDISISWGGSGEDVKIEPTRASFTVDNSTGRFTPGRATSPYYPNIGLGTRVRISVYVSGAWYVRFTGTADEWSIEWDSPSEARASVTATDDLKILARQLVPALGLFNEAIIGDHPTLYYPLTDKATPARSGLSTGIPATSYVSGDGKLSWGGDTEAPPGVYDAVIQFDPGTTGSAWVEVIGQSELYPSLGGMGAASGGKAFAAWIKVPTAPIGLMYLFGAPNLFLSIDQAMRLYINTPAGAGGTTAGPIITPVVWHYIAIRTFKIQYSGVLPPDPTYWHEFYVDGVNTYTQVTNPTADNFLLKSTNIRIGSYGGPTRTLFTAASFSGYKWGRPPFGLPSYAPNFIDQYQAAQGYPAELSDTRLRRWLDMANIPDTNRVLDVGTVTLGAQDSGEGGNTVLKLATDVIESETGSFYVDRTGRFVFRNRDSTLYPATVLATVPAAQLLGSPEFVLDDGDLVNDAQVTGPDENPIVVRAVDEASVAANGRRSTQRDTLDLNPDGPSIVTRTIIRYEAWPTPQCHKIGLDIRTASTLLDMVPGSIIAITGCPVSAPAATVYLRCIGCTEKITRHHYTFDVSTTNADVYADVGVGWRLDDVALSVLGQTTSLTI